MLTFEKMRQFTAKRQAEKEAEQRLAEEYGLYEDTPVPIKPPTKTVQPATPAETTRARKAADSRMLNKYLRTREEIDAIIRRDYRSKGPTMLGQELGMKTTTVMMRARRMGLSADPKLSGWRRSETRRSRK